jgi:hypothetical protein
MSDSDAAGGAEAGAVVEEAVPGDILVTKDQEVILIQDTGFTIKIAPPSSEPFDLQVSNIQNLYICML